MSRRLALYAAVVGCTVSVLTAQQPPPTQPGMPMPGTSAPAPGQPPRMPPRMPRPGEDPQKGTSVLRGYVTAADTGNPIRRAVVRAFSQDGRNSGIGQTDADGRFEIRDLLGGRYNLSVSKAGYVTMSYGQRRPEQAGTVLEIMDGTTVDKIAFSLPRGGVITGTVIDEFGDPVAGAQVAALRFRFMNGSRRLAPSGMGQTDDRGMFRVYGLAPGDYYVSASWRSPQAMMMGPGNVTSGPVEGYAPTYYPGTPNASEASRVSVRAGQEASNISMALVSARLARLSGRVTNSSGAPLVQGFVNVFPVDRMSTGMMMGGSAMTGADGAFQILGLPPGAYNVMVRPRGAPGPDAEFAAMRVTIGSADVDNIALMTSRGATATGVVTTDEGTPPPIAPEQVQLFARPLEPDMMGNFGEARVNPDWTFQITGLYDARLISGGIMQNPDWAIKEVLHGGIDMTDRPIEFSPGHDVEGITVVLTRRLTELSGQVLGDRNRPETDASVIIFSADPDRWTFASRYVRTARPNQDGRYTMRGMPPHEYLLAAVRNLEPGQAQDPEFLESVRGQAVRVPLTEGENKVQDLKILQE